MGRQWISNHIRKRDADIMMNYDEAIKALYYLQDVCVEHIKPTDEEKALRLKTLLSFIETAKKEHELLELYQELGLHKANPKFYNLTTQEVMDKIKELDRELK